MKAPVIIGPLITAFDTETTGLEPADHRVIEFALSVVDIGAERVVFQYEQRFDPQRSIDPKAQAVHGISYAELAGKPLFATAIPTLRKVARLAPIWLAHNANFDAGMLAAEFNRAGEAHLDIKLLDSMESRWATFNGKNPKLSELCFALGVEYDPSKAHAALYDVNVMAQAWIEGYKRGMFKLPE